MVGTTKNSAIGNGRMVKVLTVVVVALTIAVAAGLVVAVPALVPETKGPLMRHH